jgi:hypothetical protein
LETDIQRTKSIFNKGGKSASRRSHVEREEWRRERDRSSFRELKSEQEDKIEEYHGKDMKTREERIKQLAFQVDVQEWECSSHGSRGTEAP